MRPARMEVPRVGQRVQCKVRLAMDNLIYGRIRYIGEIDIPETKGSIYYGIELEEPLGRNDGRAGNVRYFETGENRGVTKKRDIAFCCVVFLFSFSSSSFA